MLLKLKSSKVSRETQLAMRQGADLRAELRDLRKDFEAVRKVYDQERKLRVAKVELLKSNCVLTEEISELKGSMSRMVADLEKEVC